MNKQTGQRRLFLGKTEGFADKRERAFYQRMLKAYLKGKKGFRFLGRWYDVLSKKVEPMVTGGKV